MLGDKNSLVGVVDAFSAVYALCVSINKSGYRLCLLREL